MKIQKIASLRLQLFYFIFILYTSRLEESLVKYLLLSTLYYCRILTVVLSQIYLLYFLH